MSYMSASDPRIHFGLGKRTKIDIARDYVAQRTGRSLDKRSDRPDHRSQRRRRNRPAPFPQDSELDDLCIFPAAAFSALPLVVLGSTLLDALATPLWKWNRTRYLFECRTPLPHTPAASPVQFVDVAREAGLTIPNVWGGARPQTLHHRSQRAAASLSSTTTTMAGSTSI